MAKIKNMGTATMRFGEGIIITGSAGTDIHALVVTGSSSLLGDLSVQDTATYNTVEYFNSNTMKFNQYYLGNANGSYFSANEYQKVVTIIPSADSQNYQVIGRITAQNAGSTHTVYFNSALRSNTLPDLSWSATYSEEHTGTRYIDPQLWVKETTTAGFIFAFKTLQTIYGNITVDIDVVPRSSDQKSNVTINSSVSSEQTSVDAGYTANDMTLVISKNSQTVSFANAYAFPTSDGNANQVLATDGIGNLTFQAQATGSGANPPGGSDRHVQFNDNGSFAGNYGILVDSNFNLKVSGSLISKESIGLGIDLGGGRNNSDEWVAITEPQHKFQVVGDINEASNFSIDQASDSVGGSYWTFTKARGTPSSPTGINTNDEIARIQFFAHTGSSTLKRTGMIYATADSDGDGRLRFYVTKEGDIDNIAIECYNNQVTVQDQMVIGSAGIIPITDGGASIGGSSFRFDYIRGNNLVAFDSLQLGGTHPIYDQGGFGISFNKDNPILGNYTSGEGLTYISNNSAIENVVFALHKTGSHFGGMALNGTVTDNDQKILFFSQYNTAGFEWKNNIPYYNANGAGNLNTTGTTLMELDSSGNLDIQGNAIVTGSIAVLGDAQITGMPGYILNYDSYADSGSTQSYAATNSGLDFITGSIDGQISTTFAAPPTGNVEIEMNFYALQTNAGSNLLLALSTNGVTWSTESGTYLRIWDGDETDANYVTAKWGITGLTPASSYTYYFGATSASPAVPNGVTIYWGRSGQTSVQYPPITIKVTTLP